MAPFFGSSFLYTRPRRRRSEEPKTTAASNDSSLPLAGHSRSLPNLEQLQVSASFLEELPPLPQSLPVLPISSPALSNKDTSSRAILASPVPAGMKKVQDSTLNICKSTQALRIVKRSVATDIADLLPGKGAVRKVKAIRKMIRELHHGIDDLYDSFHEMHYPGSVVHHHSEFSCLFHGHPIKVLDDHLDSMREAHYPLERRIKSLKRKNDALRSENCRINNLLVSVKNGGFRFFHERDRRIRELNHFITALLDVKSNMVTETQEEGEEKPTINVTVVKAVQSAAKDDNSIWAAVLPAVVDQPTKRLFIEEFMRAPKLYDEIRQMKAKYRLWKVLAQRNPEHANYITPTSSKMSFVHDGNALQSIKESEPGLVDEMIKRCHDGDFSAKHPPYFVIDSLILDRAISASAYPSAASQADAIVPSPVGFLGATGKTPMPSPSLSDLVRALPSVSACSIFSSDEESEKGSVSAPSSDEDGPFSYSNQNPSLDHVDKYPKEIIFDAALLANNKSPPEGVQVDSDERTKSLSLVNEYGSEGPSLPNILTDEAKTFDVPQDGLRQCVDNHPADGCRNPILHDVHVCSSQDMPMSLQQFEHRQITEQPVSDRSDLVVQDIEPVVVSGKREQCPVLEPSPESVSDSEQSTDISLLSSIAPSSVNGLKRLSSAGSSIKRSISNGLRRLHHFSLKSPDDTPKRESFRPAVLHQRQTSTHGKENCVPKTKQGKGNSKTSSLPSHHASDPSRSHRPTISSTLKAIKNTQLTNVTPDPIIKAKHRKIFLPDDSSATTHSRTSRRLPLTSVPIPRNVEQNSSSGNSAAALKQRRRVVHAFGNLFS